MLSKCEVEVLSVNGLIVIEVHPVHAFYHFVVGKTEVPHHQETQERQQQEAPGISVTSYPEGWLGALGPFTEAQEYGSLGFWIYFF